MRRIVSIMLVTLAVELASAAGPAIQRAEHRQPGVHGVTLRIGALDRTMTVFVSRSAQPTPAVVLALHGGSGGSGARIRGFIGAELERLAEEHGFLVAYPDGVDGSWNDCRAGASYGAKLRNINDVAFIRAVVGHLAGTFGADRQRMFAIGYSNGAHLAYRVALEAPDAIRGIAAFAANLPAAGSALACVESGRPVPALIVNGTADGINPFIGGEVVLPDGTRLGTVRSAEETLAYFGRLAGHEGPPVRLTILGAGATPPPGVRAQGWQHPERAAVALYSVDGGGHTIPSPAAAFPAFLGRHERGFSAVEAAVRFFGLAPEGSR